MQPIYPFCSILLVLRRGLLQICESEFFLTLGEIRKISKNMNIIRVSLVKKTRELRTKIIENFRDFFQNIFLQTCCYSVITYAFSFLIVRYLVFMCGFYLGIFNNIYSYNNHLWTLRNQAWVILERQSKCRPLV